MIKVAEVYKAAQSGSEQDLDFIQKTAAIFGETATENFLRASMGYETIKQASEEKCVGIIAVIKSAQAGSGVDLDYLEKISRVIGVEGIEKLAENEQQQRGMHPGLAALLGIGAAGAAGAAGADLTGQKWAPTDYIPDIAMRDIPKALNVAGRNVQHYTDNLGQNLGFAGQEAALRAGNVLNSLAGNEGAVMASRICSDIGQLPARAGMIGGDVANAVKNVPDQAAIGFDALRRMLSQAIY